MFHHRRMLFAGLLVAGLLVGVGGSPALAGQRQCRNGYVSLSYDDGPTTTTPALLAALRRGDLRVTFFDVGERAESLPSLVEAQRLDGHAIANHSYNHANLASLDEAGAFDQLARTQQILTPLAFAAPEFYRPPYGATSPTVRSAAARAGLTEVVWTVDTNDWDGRSTAAIVATALTVQAGGFVLMHDGYANTVAAVPKIASGLARRGLCAGRIAPSAVPTNAWLGLDFPATVSRW